MTRTYQPLGNRVLVQLVEEDEVKTRGGLIVPDTAKERPQDAKVLAVGPGKLNEDGKRQPMEVKEGNLVLFAKYAGTEVKGEIGEDDDILVLREDDILAIVTEAK